MGLILVVLYLLMGIDDFIWDIVTMFRRRSYRKELLDLHLLDRQPPKLLAVAIAAWHEDTVLGHVIENMIQSVQYPKSMYHIFLGIYPNDAPTLAVAGALAEKYSNVHLIVNEMPGPTSKAQNINYIIQQIKEFEAQKHWRFASLTVHDAEDVVHPYELKVTNYLLEKYPALQFPVFPIMKMPKLSNFFENITTGTYADEFAENHFTTMVSRYSAGAFVPSAGTGFALSRKTLDIFGDGDVLSRDSLTEDYRLSLSLYEKGVRMYYVLERVPRVDRNNRLTWDFIATRSLFPKTFKTAVRQKTRWILGITMQSFKFRDIFKTKGIRFTGRYSLYKDLKAKVSNLLAMVGYPVLVYFVVSLFIPLTPLYPAHTLSWYLCIAVTVMMLERQIFRVVAIYNVYGMRSVFFACLFPPLFPIRLVWGNIINLVATIRAYRQNLLGSKTATNEKKQKRRAQKRHSTQETRKFAWAKTDHEFLDVQALKRYHRNLGDILLEKGFLSIEVLRLALQKSDKSGQMIGNYLIEQGLLTEEQLLDALSNQKHIRYIDVKSLDDYRLHMFASFFEEELLRELQCLPLVITQTGFVVAFCDSSPNNAQTILRKTFDITINAVFTSRESVNQGLDIIFSGVVPRTYSQSFAEELFARGVINYEQMIIVHSYGHESKKNENELLYLMGLLDDSHIPEDIAI